MSDDMPRVSTVGNRWSDMTYGQLVRAEKLGHQLAVSTAADSQPDSRLADDAEAIRPLAIAQYVKKRGENAALLARVIHRLVLEREEGKMHFEFPALYPLIRAVYEDCATLTWLLAPPEKELRLLRFTRLLWADQRFYVANHVLLATALTGDPRLPEKQAAALTSHMESEKVAVDEHFTGIAARASIPDGEWKKAVTIRETFDGAFGDSSLTHVLWRFLSDLSHYSFVMSSHLDNSVIEDGPTVQALLLQFLGQMNQMMEHLITEVANAKAASA